MVMLGVANGTALGLRIVRSKIGDGPSRLREGEVERRCPARLSANASIVPAELASRYCSISTPLSTFFEMMPPHLDDLVGQTSMTPSPRTVIRHPRIRLQPLLLPPLMRV